MSFSPVLKLFVINNDETLIKKYKEAIENHNDQVTNNPYPDAGFDLFVPETRVLGENKVEKINMQVKAAMTTTDSSLGYCLHPRSSIHKTSLRLANSTGIIDSGYRGPLIGIFDCIDMEKRETIEQFQRLIQVCSPTLTPFTVEIVSSEAELGKTTRGEGGLGSTGK